MAYRVLHSGNSLVCSHSSVCGSVIRNTRSDCFQGRDNGERSSHSPFSAQGVVSLTSCNVGSGGPLSASKDSSSATSMPLIGQGRRFGTKLMSAHKNFSQSESRCLSGRNSPNVTTDTEERSKVKQQLLNLIEETDGTLTEDCLALVSCLEKLNPTPEATRCPELYEGCFQTIRATLKGTGRFGEGQNAASAFGSYLTLGRTTFNAFKPVDQEISVNEIYNHVAQGSADDYSLITQFSLKNSEGAASATPPLEGLIINKAKFDIAGPNRKDIVFVSVTMRPLHPERESDLEAWKKLFQEANPSMDEKGYATIPLPSAKGWLDYLYLDEELRISRGNRGNVYVVRRLKEPAVSV